MSRRRVVVLATSVIAALVGPITAGSAGEAARGGPVEIRGRKTADLYAACLAEQGAASGWCSAYLIGVADTLAAFGDGGNKGGICRADYVIEQLPEIFLTWARTYAEFGQIDMLAGASLAFRARWPC